MIHHDVQRVRLESLISDLAEDHRSEATRLLQDLVRTPSYSTQEGRHDDPASVVGRLWQELAGHQTAREADRVGDNSENVSEVLAGSGEETLVLAAHTDIVPEGDPRLWMGEGPFSAELGSVTYLGQSNIEVAIGDARTSRVIRDKMARVWERRSSRTRQIVYGRGSFDNKGAVVSLALATAILSAALEKTGVGLGGTLISAYTADEEAGSTGIMRFACNQDSWLARKGLLRGQLDQRGFHTGIVGAALDGSYGWIPVIGHRGALQIVITTHGRASHASTPSLGVNAVEAMSRILVVLADGADEISAQLSQKLDDSLLGPATVAVGTTIVGGGIGSVSRGGAHLVVERSGVNAVPDWCEATVDVRFPPGRDYPEDLEAVYGVVLESVRDFVGPRLDLGAWTYEIEPIDGSRTPPVAMARNLSGAAAIPIVSHLRARTAQILGHDAPLEIAPGGTDATFMVHNARIPSLVELGPAGALSHDTDEYVELDDVISGAKILALLAIDLLGTVE